ncbi:suppressor of fused domain protein [Actinotalea ferrariae]|uniref:suppressor of fused domain protein n=1 Tax=Actinotalea ferrariae TaxID=1386098 RepID=UPI001C8B684F|nr:suppressor of fused domain protein [Actinotalea ferrariae]MBX9243493.1 suppressor of fused domain protein [Actinotalea ferrariae]
MTSAPSRVERYLAHLDVLTGGAEPQFWPVESRHSDLPSVTAIGYRDLPDDGLFTGLTYGLSLAENPLWQHGRPELCISVRSDDSAWVLAAAFLAEQLRGSCPFQYGDTLNFGEPVAAESAMDGFVVFAPAVLDRDSATIDVGDDHPPHVQGLYPVYSSEREFIRAHGLQAFWQLDWDPYDVTRAPAA